MARARNIKPEFFQNAELAELPAETRLLFIGLWTLADAEGRLEDRTKQIKMELYPADSYDVDAMLQQLHHTGFIDRYESDKTRYIQIVNFCQWCSSKTPESVNADGAVRRAIKSNALPKWADREVIKEIYKSARSISQSSGDAHHVDHEIPLKGKNVCGLHVAANLRVIPAIDNLKKSNKFEVNHG